MTRFRASRILFLNYHKFIAHKFKISFYQDGKYLQSSNFSIEDDENPKHLVVKSEDGATYQIQNVETSEVGRLYPLFKK